MNRRIGWRAALLFAGLLSIAGCRKTEGDAPRTILHPGAPVIVISIDTLRADRLPLYGYQGVETPHIDALASDALVFDNAYTHCPLTLPAHLSMLTGLLPQEHGVRDNIGYAFDSARHRTIPALLREAGYRSGAAVSAYVLRTATGISSDFDAYDDAISVVPGIAVGSLQRSGEQSVTIAEQWIGEQGDRPFFYFLHLFEPHAPWEPPEPFRSRYADPYDGEIAESDRIVGRFIDYLEKSGIYEKAVVILMSDHGEGLGDHGEEEHGIFLYREAIHIPLIVKLPKGELRGKRVVSPAQLIDILPTIAELTGAKLPAGLRGKSLVALAQEKSPAERRVFSETLYPRIHLGWSDLRSLAGRQYHYIDAPRPELYDLTADPAEKHDLLSTERRVAAAMRNELEEYGREITVPETIDPEEAKKLAALGYLSPARPTMASDLPDPKDRIGDIEEVKRAFSLSSEGRFDDAIRALTAILEKNPNWSDVWNRLAMTWEEVGELEKAAETYQHAIRVAPSLAPELALSLGAVLEKLGRFDEAEAHAALAMETNRPAAHQLTGQIALTRGDLPRAEREARAAAAFESHRLTGTLLLAQIHAARGELAQALAVAVALEKEIMARNGPPMQNLAFLRGDLLARMDRTREAEAAFRQEISAFPSNRQAYANLALIYFLQERTADGHRMLEEMAAASPGRRSYLLAAKTLDALGDPRGAGVWRRRAGEAR
ncbi:MAG TPA: sulfatase-like hydrolase/transferase [Thermoanaerobaculia bacterium]|nr:sulfatase-like hydrolase/transferase [Thermoanaerobaculia bacterium]